MSLSQPIDPLPQPIDEPSASTKRGEPAVVRINRAGEVYVEHNPKAADHKAIVTWARSLMMNDPMARVTIAADNMTTHGAVMQVIDALKEGGLTRIAFAVLTD